MVMTADCFPNSEALIWLAEQKLGHSDNAENVPSWRGVCSFVKVHTIHNISTKETLGSTVLHYSGSVPTFGDFGNAAVTPIPPSTSSLDSNLNVCLVQKSLAKCLHDCNQLTWFHFRSLLPCAITSLVYRLTISGDREVQILCSGVAICPSSEETTVAASIKNTSLVVPSKFDGGKSSSTTSSCMRKGIFNRQKSIRSGGSAIELKSIEQNSAFKSQFVSQQKENTKKHPKKSKWWRILTMRVPTTTKVCYNSRLVLRTSLYYLV